MEKRSGWMGGVGCETWFVGKERRGELGAWSGKN